MTDKILTHRMGRLFAMRSGAFKHGNSPGAGKRIRDSRHAAHPRGGNHRDHHARDGNPRG